MTNLSQAERIAPALEELIQHPTRYDMLLTDLTMPDLMGMDLAAHLKKAASRTAILVTTGHGEELQANENDTPMVIAKPLAMKELAVAIKKMLENGGN